MGIFNFPSNFVYWEDVKNHDMIKPILLSKIEKIKEKYKNNRQGLIKASTTYNTDVEDIITHPDMIKHIVWDPLDNAVKYINSKPDTPETDKIEESFVCNSWYTLYDKDGYFNFHEHDSKPKIVGGKIFKPSFSMIYILKDDNERNSTSFLQTTQFYNSVYSDSFQHSFDTCDVKDIKEGSVLIFPASLYHCVHPVIIPGRITIAINIYSHSF
jgi:hypothetical protein